MGRGYQAMFEDLTAVNLTGCASLDTADEFDD